MYFEIEGSTVRLGGTMHWVPKGCPLAYWVHDAISRADIIYLEHEKQEFDRGRYAPPGLPPLAQRLPRSWPRIEGDCPPEVLSTIAPLRPSTVASQFLDPGPIDPGVELLVMAISRGILPPGPRIKYLETAAQSYALTDDVSDDVWDEAVSWVLDNPGSYKTLLELSYSAWFAGDFEEVDRISTLHSRNRFAPIKHAIITARNDLWLLTIRELVQSAREPILVLVGAAHLGGTDGLLSKLAAGGLRLTFAARQ
jgi:TraB/PrgY/gumN family